MATKPTTPLQPIPTFAHPDISGNINSTHTVAPASAENYPTNSPASVSPTASPVPASSSHLVLYLLITCIVAIFVYLINKIRKY